MVDDSGVEHWELDQAMGQSEAESEVGCLAERRVALQVHPNRVIEPFEPSEYLNWDESDLGNAVPGRWARKARSSIRVRRQSERGRSRLQVAASLRSIRASLPNLLVVGVRDSGC